MTNKAVILLSGGMDSATCLAIAHKENYDCYAISFNYGQRHNIELTYAKRLAYTFGAIEHLIIDIDMRRIGGSALTADIEVPEYRPRQDDTDNDVPVTYVPARNTVFLSFALSWAETLDATNIFIGVNSVDYSGYPDCRPEYIAAYESMACLATANPLLKALKIQTPLAHMSKKDIIEEGHRVGVDFQLTHTCYNPTKEPLRACGTCDACMLRLKGFEQAGITDPIQYA